MKNQNGQLTIDFGKELEPLYIWPSQSEIPINLDFPERVVEEVVLGDLNRAREFTITTGYTSLSYLIDCFGSKDYPNVKTIRIVLGFDPNFRGRKRYHPKPLDIEIAEYWLKKRLSILQGGSIINLISKIESRRVQVRFYNRMHAKIYASENSVILGSANFSNNGLKKQTEANIRILKENNLETYNNIKLLSDNYFDMASEYVGIIELLQNLISEVDWKDALARAIAEVLEGKWLKDYQKLMNRLQSANLWPIQKRGLAQAMGVLQENSNVLIADPTGAGKTKLCSTIILALKSWLYETGRQEKENAVIVCPPLVTEKWKKEFRDLSAILNNQISNGTLSNAGRKKLSVAEKELELANILAIDEAHNFLNLSSKRSIAIRKNNAEFKLLITATPINKKIDDLLKIVELLDIDNLDDESFESFKSLRLQPHLRKPEDILKLKQFVSRFTVRRTKKFINKQIEKEPDLYKNALGELCKFPEQNPIIYQTEETERDKAIVKQIDEICQTIKGVTYLKRISKPKFELTEDKTQEYLNRRFNAARQLSIYMIRSRLRSSKMALLEHISGMAAVQAHETFPCKKNRENTVKIDEIDKLSTKNKLPFVNKDFKNFELPTWFTELDAYQQVCAEEKAAYLKIAGLTKKLSNQRELGKVNTLAGQLKSHQKIIAFDSCIITLNYLRHLMKKNIPGTKVLVATGSDKSESEEVLEKFSLTSENDEKIIALCSDKMSEGVDLQKASSVTLLDLPSVIRIVEQRFGRVDRLDTLHSSIDMFWPDDSAEFSLKGDKRLLELNHLVENMLGSNFDAPEALKFKHFQNLESIGEIINEFKEYSKNDVSWEGIHDSFQPIIDLKEGVASLISEEEYESYKGVSQTVNTGVSFLESTEEWCFIAVRGDKNHSPKWFFIRPQGEKEIFTEFPEICQQLRTYLVGKPLRVPWNKKYLEYYLKILEAKERQLLSPKKKRALSVAEELLGRRYRQQMVPERDRAIISKLLELFKENLKYVDLDAFAGLWTDFFQPYIDDKRERNMRNRQSHNLHSLMTPYEFAKINFDPEVLEKILIDTPLYEEIDHKIAACIVGVPDIGKM